MMLRGLLVVLGLSWALPSNAITIPHAPPTVINTNDNGAGSLRQALLKAQNGDTITFDIPTSDPRYKAGIWTIDLTSGQLAIDRDLTISGPGANHLIVQWDQSASSSRIFRVDSPHMITIEGVTIRDERAEPARLILLTGGTTAMLFLSVALFCRHLWRRTQKRIRFGLLWNGHRQPICAKCSHPLYVLNDYSFQCPHCQVELGAQGENGFVISPREALAKIRLKEYWSRN
jgi:hypothetical protein